MARALRFTFKNNVSGKLIDSQMRLALVTAECLFGQAKVRLKAGCVVSKNRAIVKVSDKIGEYIAEIFTGLMTRQVGEDRFTVDRIRVKDSL